MKKFFSFKDAFYLDNSNATSFSSIGHSDGKLFNFLTVFGHFGGSKWPPGGGLREWVKNFFTKISVLFRRFECYLI